MKGFYDCLSEIHNPVDLALTRALDVKSTSENPQSELANQSIVNQLEDISEDCDFLGRYYATTTHAFGLPKEDFNNNNQVPIKYYREEDRNLIFSGNLLTYAVVEIGRIELENINVKALCLTFEEVVLLSFFSNLEDDYLLHVPVFSIEDLSRET